MARISPGRGNSGNSAIQDPPSSRSRRSLPVNDRRHQDPPVVPQIFDASRSSHQGSTSRTNSSGCLIPLNSQNPQIPAMPPFQGYNPNVLHQLPNGRHRRFPSVGSGVSISELQPDFVQDRGPNWSNPTNGGGVPPTRNLRRSTTYQERTASSTGNSFSSLRLPNGRHQQQVPRNSEWFQLNNGIIPRNIVVGNENLRRSSGHQEDPTTFGLGVLILIPENFEVLQLPVVIHAHNPREEHHHSSNQRRHFDGYNRNRWEHNRNHHHSRRYQASSGEHHARVRGTRDFPGSHSSGEHAGHSHHLPILLESSQVIDEHYIIDLDSQIRSSMDDGFDNIMFDHHQHDIFEEQQNYDATTSGLSEEYILKHLKTTTTLIREPTTTSPTDPCSSTSADNEICTICQDEFEENNMITTLDCGHKYHVDCIKKWLLINNQCPLCKRTCLTFD